MPNNKKVQGSNSKLLLTANTTMNANTTQNIQENIADLFSHYDHLSPPSFFVVSSLCTNDEREHNILSSYRKARSIHKHFQRTNHHNFQTIEENCKMITDKIDKHLVSITIPEDKCNTMYSHFLCLVI